MNRHQLENSNDVVFNVHEVWKCAGRPCPIHNLSDHVMRSFPQRFVGTMKRECPHEVLHPDPDEPWSLGAHDCECGCCRFEMPDLGNVEDIDRWLRS